MAFLIRKVSNNPRKASDKQKVQALKKQNKFQVTIGNYTVPSTPEDIGTLVGTLRLVDARTLNELSYNINSKQMATMMLGALDMVVRNDMGKNYSIVGDQNNPYMIDNPNIVPSSIGDISNSLSDPSKQSFKSHSDPFYELDEGAPEYYKEQQNLLKTFNEKDLTQLAAAFNRLNNNISSPGTKNLKQFNVLQK
tara:strand:+ start:80649 stop:81230 length:582 start_codon:yes stop_codon:yes gene_type:complete